MENPPLKTFLCKILPDKNLYSLTPLLLIQRSRPQQKRKQQRTNNRRRKNNNRRRPRVGPPGFDLPDLKKLPNTKFDCEETHRHSIIIAVWNFFIFFIISGNLPRRKPSVVWEVNAWRSKSHHVDVISWKIFHSSLPGSLTPKQAADPHCTRGWRSATARLTSRCSPLKLKMSRRIPYKYRSIVLIVSFNLINRKILCTCVHILPPSLSSCPVLIVKSKF